MKMQKYFKNKKSTETLKILGLIEKYFLILTCTITGCVSVSPFACLLGIPIEITSSVIALNICAIAAANKKY